jgi:hypothetical protein
MTLSHAYLAALFLYTESRVAASREELAGIPTRSDAPAFPVCRKSAQYARRGEV